MGLSVQSSDIAQQIDFQTEFLGVSMLQKYETIIASNNNLLVLDNKLY